MAQSLESIPNNVDLSSDRRLQRALEQWQPNFLNWWKEVGPEGFQAHNIYLRTAISVEANGWAHFDYVKMPDYRWGIFLEPHDGERTIGFGDVMGEKVWTDVPGEHRNALRRIIVTQADTEPASVEQQRLLGKTCPSMYDLRNLFQVNVEEGRHLWAMVYLLHRFFGRDGREEADELLNRRSGSSDKPRILNAFNEPIDDWLSFFMFAMFTDRDGKYQLAALAQSGFDPLARTTRFMLTEEAHHLFVGETGVDRIVQRCAELMAQGKDPAREGAVPLALIQKSINLWFTLSLDLFGGEVSSNAADFFASGLKGRFREDTLEEHKAMGQHYQLEVPENGKLVIQEVPLRNAMNEVLRDEYVKDCQRAVDRWNKTLAKNGVTGMTLKLPNRRFHRGVGPNAGLFFDPDGKWLSEAEYKAQEAEFLPTAEDRAYVKTLMHPVTEPGKVAAWIAQPNKGIDGKPIDFEYVKPPEA
ncbi:MAG TPA: benzoyl-CoA 2,3-epoxidase subunit BoxB [Myxococcales bacterium]|jgi:benzoyl-CoA 2,3-dioxygenase component B|nr:benzoyl-CoA 2,3-epoxidase subunit BoxB [Myxococcales bacterium]